ncbi:hypothetical protein AN958_07427 [Leucoagaricus sp. SymC.cos]|nr:hypothetical protein AN958_07427 [Leucoagaricus sp. SymC.cos]
MNPRVAKSASAWHQSDLKNYNISVCEQSPAKFFGHTPRNSELPQGLDSNFLTATLPHDPNLSDETTELLQLIQAIEGTGPSSRRTPEADVDLLARELLKAAHFQSDGLLLRAEGSIKLAICKDKHCYARPNVYLTQNIPHTVLLILENKRKDSRIDPEPQVIAQAIAAFQHNNRELDRARHPRHKSMTFPAITMVGTCLTFYKTTITQDLSDAVENGTSPRKITTVYKCVVPHVAGHGSERVGMESPVYRKNVMRFLGAFRPMAKRSWELYTIPPRR